MEAEFDKQIDTILRDLAKGNALPEVPQLSHLDADELSAYSENVLPNQARIRVTEHLADCLNCRNILSTLALLNTEAESEIIHENVKTLVSSEEVPWYRKIFAVPNLAYTMGALVILLVGSVSFLVYQNSKGEANLAKLEEQADKPKGSSGASSEGEPSEQIYVPNSNIAANSPMPAANSASNQVPTTVKQNSPTEVSEPKTVPQATPDADPGASNTVGRVAERSDVGEVAKKSSSAPGSTLDSGGGEKRDKQADDLKTAPVTSQNIESDNVIARQQTNEQNVQGTRAPENMIVPDGQSRSNQAPMAKRSAPPAPRREVNKPVTLGSADEKETKDAAENSKTVGGKTFRSIGGVWTDSAYRGGSTTSVKRGSDDYKKLDSGLQSIGNSIGGTVVVVWNGRNYKIQ